MSININTYSGKPLKLFDAILNWTAVIIGGSALTLLMGLMVVDVCLRYFFNSPIFGAQDISILSLVIIVAISIPYTARSGMHVAVEVIDKIIGPKGCRITDIFSRIVGFSISSMLTVLLIHGMKESEDFAETTPLLELSYSSFYLALAIGFALFSLALIIETIILLFYPKFDTNSPGTTVEE